MGYDVVAVGGGSAGCVVAARISADERRDVLLVEAGPDYPRVADLPPDIADESMQMRNECLQYRCQSVFLRVENARTPFTRAMRAGEVVAMPISHGEGKYCADHDTLRALDEQGRVVFRYATAEGRIEAGANPNGSLDNIAGIANEAGNVLGLMPHPEHAVDPHLGSTDGALVLGSLVAAARERLLAAA